MPPPYLAALALLLSPVLAGGFGEPPAMPDVPPKVAPTKLDNFTWADPFRSPGAIDRFGAACESTRAFAAAEFQLHDLSAPAPAGLQAHAGALKAAFGGRPYPGGWDGVDAHGYERSLLRMARADVPARVRAWIAAQEDGGGEGTEAPGRGLFAVLEGAGGDGGDGEGEEEEEEGPAVVFAPGALYETLPLWVAEGSGCEDALADLDSYGPDLVDGGVVGWPTEHTEPRRGEGSRSMTFTIRAMVLSEKAGQTSTTQEEAQEPVAGDAKDEL